MSGKLRFLAFGFLMLAVLITACSPKTIQPGYPSGQIATSIPKTGGAPPSITVNDQQYDGTTVIIADVVSDGPGWIAIHRQDNGLVGPPIGFAPVKDGDNRNVAVKINPSQATQVMYAMLHTDEGTVGKYEFPGPDVPVMFNGQMIAPAFKAALQNDVSNLTPAIVINSQNVSNGKVTVAEVDSPGPAWIAIHIQGPDGQPGKDIGFTAVKAGVSKNLTVTVDQASVTPIMFGMLHKDAGEIGTYEFPGPDVPLDVNGQMMASAFRTDGSTQPISTSQPTMSSTMGMSPAQPTASATNVATMIMVTPAPNIVSSVKVSDQQLMDGMVMVDDVVSQGPGWIVIYTTDANGQPGEPIGHTAVKEGDNRNVMVQIDPAKAKGSLYAQLHLDQGKVGTFEFPGPDAPLMIGVQMISGKFNLLAAGTPAPTSAPAPTTASAPTNAAAVPSPTSLVPSVTVEDQPLKNGTVTIPEVTSAVAGWLVIHRVNGDGSAGPEVGFTGVKAGVNTNVVVKLDTTKTSAILMAMLHEDHGVIGQLEFPGPDGPVMVNGQMVSPTFKLIASSNGDVLVDLSQSPNTVSHLVDINGMSLYVSLTDTPGKSNCFGDCLKAWVPVLVAGRLLSGNGVDATKLGIIVRPNGTHQATYSGAPLYTYSKDVNPGDTIGNGVDGHWFLALP